MLMRSVVPGSGDCQADKEAHRIPLGRTPADSHPVCSHLDERLDDGLVSHAVPMALNRAKPLNGHVNDPEPAYGTLLLKSAIHRKMVGDKFERTDIYIEVDALAMSLRAQEMPAEAFDSLITVEKGGIMGGGGPAPPSTGR